MNSILPDLFVAYLQEESEKDTSNQEAQKKEEEEHPGAS